MPEPLPLEENEGTAEITVLLKHILVFIWIMNSDLYLTKKKRQRGNERYLDSWKCKNNETCNLLHFPLTIA